MHYSGCFACGDEPPGGLRMRFRVGPDSTVLATFTVGREHQRAPGIAHGGLIAAASTTCWVRSTTSPDSPR